MELVENVGIVGYIGVFGVKRRDGRKIGGLGPQRRQGAFKSSGITAGKPLR